MITIDISTVEDLLLKHRDRMSAIGGWTDVFVKEYSFLIASGLDDGVMAGFLARFLRELSSRPDSFVALSRIFGHQVKFKYQYIYPVANYRIQKQETNCSSKIHVKYENIFNLSDVSDLTEKENSKHFTRARESFGECFDRYPVFASALDGDDLVVTFLR